jgi:2-oxoisovalerate dehydrogenase E1 component
VSQRRSERAILLDALRIRTTEEALLALFSAGKIAGTIHTCIGQELSALALCEALAPGDVLLSNHRCHGHYIARFGEIRTLIAELLGKPSGVCRGFGGSQHLHREGFFSSGIQGGQTPSAVGMALAMQRSGRSEIVVACMGDGTLGEGVVYESFNLASKLGVPLLYLLEDNLYAQSTSQAETLAGSIEGRARAFDLDYFCGSTFELDRLRGAADAAVRHVRERRRPAMLHVRTYRLAPHSKGDDNRQAAEIASHLERDLVHRLLGGAGSDEELGTAVRAVQKEVQDAVAEALAEPAAHRIEVQARRNEVAPGASATAPLAKSLVVKEINRALHDLMESQPDAFLLGEDVRDPYGGAFKVSRGLSTRFPDRVINMPISEAAIVGVALGVALNGSSAIAEIMFGDFLGLAFDQIVNHAAKSHAMYGKTLRVPLIVRTPMGGRRGYGATHSQSIEKHFLGAPGLDVYMLHPHVDSYAFYTTLGAHIERASLVIENKLLYGTDPSHLDLDGYHLSHTTECYPTTRLSADRTHDVTAVCFGGIGLELEKAMKRLSADEIFVDVYYPLAITGCDVSAIAESAQSTGRLVFLEEGSHSGGLSAEYLRRILSAWRSDTLPKLRFVAASDCPIPAAAHLEQQVLPGMEEIYAAIVDLYDE